MGRSFLYACTSLIAAAVLISSVLRVLRKGADRQVLRSARQHDIGNEQSGQQLLWSDVDSGYIESRDGDGHEKQLSSNWQASIGFEARFEQSLERDIATGHLQLNDARPSRRLKRARPDGPGLQRRMPPRRTSDWHDRSLGIWEARWQRELQERTQSIKVHERWDQIAHTLIGGRLTGGELADLYRVNPQIVRHRLLTKHPDSESWRKGFDLPEPTPGAVGHQGFLRIARGPTDLGQFIDRLERETAHPPHRISKEREHQLEGRLGT